MPKLKLSSRILLYFLLVSLVPLIVTNFLLVSSANDQLVRAASLKQQAVAKYLSDNVYNYLKGNIQSLSYLSDIYSGGDQSVSHIDRDMSVFVQQYPDMKRLAILDASGQEKIAYDQSGKVTQLANVSEEDAFKAINFLSGQEYVSSVNYNEDNEPTITLALPILAAGASAGAPAQTGIFTANENITGVILAEYNIKDLWSTVLSTKIGEGGYAYVVDGLGNLVAHPDNEFFASNQKLTNVPAVRQFIQGNFETRKTQSETGQTVISTPQVIPDSGWAVIAEEPVASINASVNSYIKLATTVGLVAIAASILVSIFFRRQLTIPIKKLSEGAKRIGKGHFDHSIDIRSNDELQELAETFNSMGLNIKTLVSQLETHNHDLATEKSKLDNIITSVSDGIIALDSQGRIISINPPAAKLAKNQPEQLITRSFAEIFPLTRDDNILEIALHEPGLRQYSEVTLRLGDQFTYLDLVVSVINSRNSDVSAIVTMHDLTKTRELDYMKLDFVAIAAHELRTPLTVVMGYLDLLKRGAIEQLTIFNIENLHKTIHSVKELRDLINKLLNIARIERGEMEIYVEKLDLNQAASENVLQHKTVANQNEQKLVYETTATGPVNVLADPSSITEVLNNLIGNALKFTGKGGQIKVTLQPGPDEVRVEVSDNGPGIPKNLREKLFTKFYRAERSLISGTRGTGLGLFISKTIIELQNGKIDILPTEGPGTTFYFTLPTYKPVRDDKLINTDKQHGGVRGWFKKNPNSRG